MKKILLAITGSIAAIKAFDLIKALQEKNFAVQCIVSKGGKKLCSVKALEAMTGFPVLGPKIFEYEKKTNPFEKNTEKVYAHLELSKISEAMIIAPCSANTLAKIAHGVADDFLSSALLAYKKPILLAPAMNTKMWENEMVQENIEKILESRGADLSRPSNNIVSIIPPQKNGILACGEEGEGKMASVKDIVLYAKKAIKNEEKIDSRLRGNDDEWKKNILINLGGTQEKIDPVRYIGNFSSGTTGKILAEKFFIHGEKNISIVQGTSTVQLSEEIFHIEKVQSAEEMYKAMDIKFQESDIIIFTAAVADFKVKNFSEEKIKKNVGADLCVCPEPKGRTHMCAPTIDLQPNIDIAQTFAAKKLPHQIFIGFCLETGNKKELKESMQKKAKAKKFDVVLGNNPKNFDTTSGNFLVYWAKEKIFEEYEGEKEKIFEVVLQKIL